VRQDLERRSGSDHADQPRARAPRDGSELEEGVNWLVEAHIEFSPALLLVVGAFLDPDTAGERAARTEARAIRSRAIAPQSAVAA
jgi:hypothetical protein